MRKEQVIKKAYGINWEKVKDFVDENGWLNVDDFYLISDGGLLSYQIEAKEGLIFQNHRPIKLKGLEHNNGWIKIESEEDLPKENIDCFVMFTDGTTSVDSYHYQTSNFMRNHKNHINYYKPLPKPELPIY